MAKYPVHAQDPYLDKASGILRNRLGITDQAELDRAEATLALVRSLELVKQPVDGRYDLAHLQEIHARLFGDVYDWAGQIRTVDISKGDTRFANFQQIESYAPEIFKPLHREQLLRALDVDTFCQRAGHYLGELNVLHPFREGNGRSIREFIGQVARGAGYAIDWKGVDRADMTKASIEAYEGDSTRMAALIRTNICDLDQERAIDLARAVVGEKMAVRPATPGRTYEGVILGVTERYVVQAQGDEMVLHFKRSLLQTPLLEAGKSVAVRYPHGGVGLVEGWSGEKPAPALEREIERTRDRDLER
ncbi:MAG: Fic/DOC family protein [Achromobacter xylosoxidans]